MQHRISKILSKTKENHPLIHFLTNYVSVNDCANLTLMLGASPIMADEKEEIEEIASLVQALVLNIGTLNVRTLESMLLAGKIANKKRIPILLDPVGAGVSRFRNEALKQILDEIQISVIKGNTSEMAYLAGYSKGARGVDANPKEQIKSKIFMEFAKKYQCLCAITGEKDFLIDGKRMATLKNGIKELSLITGSGCMISAMIASFLGGGVNAWDASLSGIAIMGISGEVAKEQNGDFRSNVIQNIGSIHQYLERLRYEEY